MTREEHLKFCKVCKNRKSNMDKGVYCGLTNEIASFEESCSFYMEDVEEKERLEANRIEYELFMKTASQGKRFANYILDMIFFYIFCIILGVLIGVIFAIVAPGSATFLNSDSKLMNYLIGFILLMIYYSIFEGLTGRSLAKYITRTKVVNDRGEKPSFSTILLRTLCRFIPFEPFSFFISDGSGWHDRISNTRVVEV